MEIQAVKRRFGIIGNSQLLNRAIDIAMQVASTDLTVFIAGESGVGKESFPKIIHQFGSRKHGAYTAVNCGAIPEGTIDSELFGHEKGSFTGAHDTRKGYFEVSNGGTIFLDEVAELPLSTQVRLLRVLESGEFYKVGSSKVQKTDVRVVAATNVDIPNAIKEGKFRQDLYYRLNTVPIQIPPLRERKEDIYLLFRKFANDFSERYRMPVLRLNDEAKTLLETYRWPGNIRELKNITEQMSIIEKERILNRDTLAKYLPKSGYSELPVLYKKAGERDKEDFSEREILYKILFDMKKDVAELKRTISSIMRNDEVSLSHEDEKASTEMLSKVYDYDSFMVKPTHGEVQLHSLADKDSYNGPIAESEVVEENLSLEQKEIQMIRQALKRHHGKRKAAATDLGISERTLYRKIKEYEIVD